MKNYSVSIGDSEFSYDPETGEFTWVSASRKPFLTGKRADHEGAKGYRYIKVAQKVISASRTAYQLVHGEIPDGMEIDHINRDQSDNRIANLRVVDRAQNLFNREFGRNFTGVTGVSLHKGGLYRARYRDKTKYAKTLEEASKIYATMRSEYAALIYKKQAASGEQPQQGTSDEIWISTDSLSYSFNSGERS